MNGTYEYGCNYKYHSLVRFLGIKLLLALMSILNLLGKNPIKDRLCDTLTMVLRFIFSIILVLLDKHPCDIIKAFP